MNIRDFTDSLDYLFKAQVTGFVWGHSGLGKSSIIKQYAKKKNWHFFPMYLGTQSDLGDVLGLASFVKDETGKDVATTFATPEWLKDAIDYCNANPDSGAIIFLDEFNRARRDVLNGMFSLALDKTFHTIKLPANCHIIAAGNPPTDEYNVTDINETALMARFVHVKLEPTIDEWMQYAKETNMEGSLVSFIQEQPELLEEKKSHFDLPVKVDRRAYERLDKLFKLGTPNHLMKQLMSGIIGIERTAAYYLFLQNSEKPLTAAAVLSGLGMPLLQEWSKPDNIKASYISITCDNVKAHLADLDKESKLLTDVEQEHLAAFIHTIPKDVAYALVMKLTQGGGESFKKFGSNSLYEAKLVDLIKSSRVKDAALTEETKKSKLFL